MIRSAPAASAAPPTTPRRSGTAVATSSVAWPSPSVHNVFGRAQREGMTELRVFAPPARARPGSALPTQSTDSRCAAASARADAGCVGDRGDVAAGTRRSGRTSCGCSSPQWSATRRHTASRRRSAARTAPARGLAGIPGNSHRRRAISTRERAHDVLDRLLHQLALGLKERRRGERAVISAPMFRCSAYVRSACRTPGRSRRFASGSTPEW